MWSTFGSAGQQGVNILVVCYMFEPEIHRPSFSGLEGTVNAEGMHIQAAEVCDVISV